MTPFKTIAFTTSFPLFFIQLHFLLFLLISITSCSSATSHGCHEEERWVLLNFKSFLDDPANRLSTWQDNVQHRNCCNWRGIGCSRETFHVVSINLRNTKLEYYLNEHSYRGHFNPPSTSLLGKLSPYILNITHLEYLDLSFNDFQNSQIPLHFSSLTKLAHLDLSGSNFSALISTQFTNLSSLQYLDLSCRSIFHEYNCFQSFSIKWIRGLVNLQVLKLSGIDLSYSQKNAQLTSSLHNLTSLSNLDLSRCDLDGLIPHLPRLKELDVSENPDLHTDLTRMFEHPWPRLQKLLITNTVANGSIPSSISNKAPLLVSLSAQDCSIQGSLPSSIYNLSLLQHLDLSGNNITDSFRSSFSNLKHLHFLDLSVNNLQGPIPKSICDMFSLGNLYLGNNKITGTLPSCITNLRNLSALDVSSNSLRGTLSLTSLINELNLTSLSLSFNKLTVGIDEHLQPYRYALEYLRLQSCNLNFFIPTSICNLTHLQVLSLSDNNLTGAIPSCISRLENLDHLDLSNNKLLGPLPLPPPAIYSIYLSHNKLNGEISIEAGERLSRALIVNLNNNEFSGSVPSSICSEEAGILETIDFSHNKLSGIIPSSLGYCRSLFGLNLAYNNLTGNFPDGLPGKGLYLLKLNNNNLGGQFPKSILSFLGLAVLNLGNNNFEGIIPTGLGSHNYLAFISLRSNKFTGFIPEDITQLHQLHILDLSMNNLSGSIPIKIGNLTTLKRRSSSDTFGWDVQYQLVIKGSSSQFERLNDFRSGIDLSCNNLDGNIPDEIGLLNGLVMLNLSYNHLSNNIPASIGNMSSLDSLDLSFNRLSGHIPLSLASIDTLGYLNLSHNNLSGRIPRGNHFDTLSLNGSAFAGNYLLCGFPLKKDCEGDHSTDADDSSSSSKLDEDDQGDGKEKFLLYAIVAMGFAVGFWGLFFALLINKQKWWFPYWRIVDSVVVKIVEGCIYKK